MDDITLLRAALATGMQLRTQPARGKFKYSQRKSAQRVKQYVFAVVR